jgi:hypothetical protein
MIWSNQEVQILKDNCYEDNEITYDKLSELIPNKTLKQIKSKCEHLGLNVFVNNSRNTWTNSEITLLKELYHNTPKNKLIEIFNNKSWSSIYTTVRRLDLRKDDDFLYLSKLNNLSLTPSAWTNEKNDKMLELFNYGGIDLVLEYFISIHTRNFIIKKMKENNLIGDSNSDKIREIIDVKFDKNTRICHIDTIDCLKLYREVLNNNIDNYCKITLNKNQLKLLFKYYIRKYKNHLTREDWLNTIIGNLLDEAKLKSQVKKQYHSYYDFIVECFPKYNFKQWEFKYLNVSEGFWENKYNRMYCVRNGIDKLFKDKVIDNVKEILGLDIQFIYTYFHKTLITYYGKSVLLEYLSFIKINIDDYNPRIYNGILFDSIEEKEVYKYFLENLNVVIYKNKEKWFNELYDEGYIHDFVITHINNKPLYKPMIVEYFGLYNNNYEFNGYNQKTQRKTEFYQSLNNIQFLGIYPQDIKDNFRGLQEKLVVLFNL